MTRSPRYDRRGNEGGLDDGDKMGREDFEDWVLNRLSELGELTTRPMFGGHGLYWRDVIFGMVFRDRLYFKVDDPSKEVTTPAVLPAYPFTENDDRARSIRREGLESGRAVARHSGF